LPQRPLRPGHPGDGRPLTAQQDPLSAGVIAALSFAPSMAALGAKPTLCSQCPVTDRERFDILQQRFVSPSHGRDMIAGTFG
jgi:hypothetical protein